jgi:hypothetical protein
MTEITDASTLTARVQWIVEGRPIPLEVVRSAYDDTTVSWEVMYTDSPWNGNGGSSMPIAEFTSWREAHDWASREAHKSTRTDDSRRTLGPMTHWQQAHHDAWEAYNAGTGPHPFTTDHERIGLR